MLTAEAIGLLDTLHQQHTHTHTHTPRQCVSYLRLRCRWKQDDGVGGPGGRGHLCPANCEPRHTHPACTHTPATHTHPPCLKNERKKHFFTLKRSVFKRFTIKAHPQVSLLVCSYSIVTLQHHMTYSANSKHFFFPCFSSNSCSASACIDQGSSIIHT